MSTHNIHFHGEIRKNINNLIWVEKCIIWNYDSQVKLWFIGWFAVELSIQHYYGHVEHVSFPNHTFPVDALSSKWLISTYAHSFARN